MSSGAGHLRHWADDGLASLDELTQRTLGEHPIRSVDELRNAAFGTDEEIDEFLAFVASSRNADLA